MATPLGYCEYAPTKEAERGNLILPFMQFCRRTWRRVIVIPDLFLFPWFAFDTFFVWT